MRLIDTEKIIFNAKKWKSENPQLRLGQAIFISAFQLYPKTTIRISGEFDCFYEDTKIDMFLEAIKKAWLEEEEEIKEGL